MKKIYKFNRTEDVNKKYTYDYMENGKYISPILRRAYSSIISKLNDKHNPFNDKNIIQFAKENYLFEKKDALYKPEGFEEKQKYSSLAHMIPRSQLERLYLHDDWGTLTENNESGFINIKDQKIPFATMENNDTPLEDLRNPAVMGPKYERALELLMKDYTTRLR